MPIRVAPSVRSLLDEATRRSPGRSRASDGTIGDAAHASRASDHNPKPADRDGVRWVDAADLTHDPVGGCDAHGWAREAAANGDERIRYLISRRQIWNPSGQAWATYRALRARGLSRRAAARGALPGWQPYSGSNPHEKHAHLSVKPTAEARKDTTPWWYPTEAAAPSPSPEVRPMFDPPVSVAAMCAIPGGVAAVAPDGAVFCEPPSLYAGGANAKSWFAGQRAARIRAARGDHPVFGDELAAGKVYAIESVSGGTYHFPAG